MSYSCPVVKEGLDLAFINMHTMGSQYFCFKDILLLNIGYDGHPKIFTTVLYFLACFREVDEQRYIQLVGQRGSRMKDFLGTGIRGMRPYRRDDEWMPLPLFDKRACSV